MLRFRQAMSHDSKARAVAKGTEEVRSRCLRVRLRCPVDGARGCISWKVGGWLSRSRVPVMKLAATIVCYAIYTAGIRSTGKADRPGIPTAQLECHNETKDEQDLERPSKGHLSAIVQVCTVSAFLSSSTRRSNEICVAIADFGPAEARSKQGLGHARRYWLTTFLPPARPEQR